MIKEIEKEVEVYREFLKRNGIDSPDNSHLIRIALLLKEREEIIGAASIQDYWKRFLKENPGDQEIEFYTHIPYCVHKCHFCCYPSSELQRPSDLNDYVEKLIKYYRFFAPTFRNISFSNLCIGGGTPSILEPEQMKTLFSEIFSSFKFIENRQRSIEFNPSSSSYAKLAVVRELGFNRVSFGVQSFDAKTLQVNNRGYQELAMVEEAISDAKKLDFGIINIDLLAGLYGDTSEKLVKSFDTATGLGPDTIYIYSVKPGSKYLSDVCGVSQVEFMEKKRSLMDEASVKIAKIADEKGYIVPYSPNSKIGMREIGTLIFIRKGFKPSEKSIFKRNDARSIFGLGTHSHSYIRGSLYYRMIQPLVINPEEYPFSVNYYDEKKEMLTQICYSLNFSGSVDLHRFTKIFGKDLLVEFKDSVSKLKRLGVVKVDDSRIALNSDKKREWMLYFLFFFGREYIENIMEKRSNRR